jgi:Zn-finger protein
VIDQQLLCDLIAEQKVCASASIAEHKIATFRGSVSNDCRDCKMLTQQRNLEIALNDIVTSLGKEI